MTPPLYRIKHWSEAYDSGEARKLRRLTWVQMPNRHDGLAMRRLGRRTDGPALFGAWCLMVQVSSQNSVSERGLLSSNGKPLTAEDLFVKTGFPEESFVAALEYFSSGKVGWLEIVSPEDLVKSPDTSGGNTDSSGENQGLAENHKTAQTVPDEKIKSPESSGKSPDTDRQDRTDRTGQEREDSAHARTLVSEDAVRREVARLPAELQAGRFPASWSRWIRHRAALKLPFEREAETILHAQAKFCAEIARTDGLAAAIDSIEWPMRNGKRDPKRPPAGWRATIGDGAASSEAASGAEIEHQADAYLPITGWKPPVLPKSPTPPAGAGPDAAGAQADPAQPGA